VEHSVVRGSGRLDIGDPAQNCVQVSYDAVGIIRFNRIADSDYIPASWGASGILAYNAGPGTVIEGNEVVRCEGAIWLVASPAANIPISVRGNIATANYGGGLWIQGHSGAVVEGNELGLPLSTDTPVYDDTPSGNTWQGNYYSDHLAGPYAIDGGPNVDAAPLGTSREFVASTTVPLGAVPVEALVLDVDGAGRLDFVTVNEGATPSLSVGLWNGIGYATSNLPFGNALGRPVSVVAGEFDGNPGIDVAVLTVNVPPATTENKVYVFSNSAGTLSLLHTETLPVSCYVPND